MTCFGLTICLEDIENEFRYATWLLLNKNDIN